MNDQPGRRPQKSGKPGTPGKQGKPYRRPQKDPVRYLAFEALRAVDERDAYANLVLPPLLRKAREKGDFDARDAALATELVYGTLRRRGHVRRDRRRLHRPAAAGGRPACSRCAEHGRPPAARHADPHARGRVGLRGAGAGRAGRRARQVRERRAPQGGAGRPRRVGGEGRAAVRRGRRGPSRRGAFASAMDRVGAVGLARRRPCGYRGPVGGRQRAARGDARGAARADDRGCRSGRGRRGVRAAGALVAVRRAAHRGR